VPEIVRDGIEGFLASDVDHACEAVEKLPAILRADCRARAEQSFSAPVIVGQYERLYLDRLCQRTKADSS
jgi:glycosyltransferase involved in cell wall biosynthesis